MADDSHRAWWAAPLAAALTIAAPWPAYAAPAATAPYTVSATVTPATVLVRRDAKVTGTVSPAAPKAAVTLERYYAKAWHKVATATLSSTSRYTFTVRRTDVGAWPLRVRKAAGARPAGVSRTVTLTSVTKSLTVKVARPAAWSWESSTSVTGSVSPASPGLVVSVQRQEATGAWTTLKKVTLPQSSTFSLTAPARTGDAPAAYRALAPYTKSYAAGESAAQTVTRRTPTGLGAGAGHTCVVGGGSAACWGTNGRGELGSGATSEGSPVPVTVPGLADAVQVSAGRGFTCARTAAGAVYCWGSNGLGELGDGTRDNRATPGMVSTLGRGVTDLSSGGAHSCAVVLGAAKCWGTGGEDQLGNLPGAAPTPVRQMSSGVVAVAAGDSHSCSLTDVGGVWCWGSNRKGQLGSAHAQVGMTPNPQQVTGLESGVAAIDASGDTTCAVTKAGAVLCWGDNANGQLGNGTKEQVAGPVGVAGLESGVTSVSVGGAHVCAVHATGAVSCWGVSSDGALGAGTTTDSSVPVPVENLTDAAVVSAGSSHTCALTTARVAMCWGSERDGRLGNGSRDEGGNSIPVPSPVPVTGLGPPAVAREPAP